MTSEPVPAIYQAIVDVMADVKAVGKDEKNASQGFAFRGIDNVLNSVGPAMRRHGVFILPLLEDVTSSTVEVGKNRTPMAHVTVRVRYRFVATDGSAVEAVMAGEAFDSGDKALSKSLSVALRSVLIEMLVLPTAEPDADATSYERAPAVETSSRFDELREATRSLADPSGVVAWVKEQAITRGSLTDVLADEWQDRIDLAASLEPESAG